MLSWIKSLFSKKQTNNKYEEGSDSIESLKSKQYLNGEEYTNPNTYAVLDEDGNLIDHNLVAIMNAAMQSDGPVFGQVDDEGNFHMTSDKEK